MGFPVASNFKGIVVGKVITVEPHPNADKLKLAQSTTVLKIIKSFAVRQMLFPA